jgi:PAS domain S-box-containing protein
MTHTNHKTGDILIVDDEPASLEILSEILSLEGYRVQPAKNGQMALKTIRKSLPDLVLLDIMMPGLTGFDVCHKLKTNDRTKDIPVIFISALQIAPEKVRAFEAGAVDYITKPFHVPEVLARVNTHITLRRTQIELAVQNQQLEAEIAIRETIEAAKNQFEKTFHAQIDAIFILNAEVPPIIVDCNNTACTMFGYSYEEIIGQTTEFLHRSPQDLREFQELLYPMIREVGYARLYDFSMRCKDGTIFSTDHSVVPLLNDEKQRIGWISVIRDVSRQKQAEDMLRKLSRATEQSASAVLITDPHGKIEYVNPAFTRISGYTPDEVIHRTPRILKSDHHSPDFYEKLWAAITADQVWEGEILNKNKAGELYWEYTTITPVKDNTGTLTNYIAVKEDITARKESEIQLQELNAQLSRLNQELLALHKIGRTLAATIDLGKLYQVMYREVFSKLLQVSCFTLITYHADTELISLNMSIIDGKVVDPSRYPPMSMENGPIHDAIVTRQPQLIDLNQIRDQLHPLDCMAQVNTNRLPQSAVYVPLISGNRVIGVLFIQDHKPNAFDDSTVTLVSTLASQIAVALENSDLFAKLIEERQTLAIRVMEQTSELRATNVELSRAVRIKDEFMANMSHELRTPLNAVLGMAEILQDEVYGPINEHQGRSIQLIEESGRHLLALINDILDISKIDAGKLSLNLKSIVPSEVCEASLRFVKQIAYKKQIDVSLNIADDLGQFYADERRLKQILVNLLTNAIKFTKEGKQVGMDVYRDQANIMFSVWDHGIGIAPTDMSHLFQPFVQIDSGLTRKYEGTGLGLSLVYRLVDMHGGSVSLESEPGQGSRFTVAFSYDLDPDTKLITPPTFEVPLQAKEISSRRLIVVEDEPLNRARLYSFLTDQGYYVVTANTGTQVTNLAKQVKPDLILMDMQLPGMDGYEAIRQLRTTSKSKRIPIIALSARNLPGDQEKCMSIGVDQYLVKPVAYNALIEHIETVLTQTITG